MCELRIRERNRLYEKAISLAGYRFGENEEEETSVAWGRAGISVNTSWQPSPLPHKVQAEPVGTPRRPEPQPKGTPRRPEPQPKGTPRRPEPQPVGTHNDRFAWLQDKYLATREEAYLSNMYTLCAELADFYIKKFYGTAGRTLDIQELAHESAVQIISQFLENHDSRIKRLSAYLFFCCKNVMSRNRIRDKRAVSLEDWMRETGETY
jgi:hypothetical protein